ncbi:MAG: amino acid racemase [Lachnospiraceae bacterium]|nr:amino acid racemase [Lachnospiraceae bacterium]
MKKIGLIGGTGPESTLMYYRELNRRIDALTGQKQMPEIVIESVDFRKMWRMVEERRYEELSGYLAQKAENLKNAGAEVISMTAATTHIVYDEVCRKSGVPLVSIPKAVTDEAVAQGIKKVGLLGTIFTMEQAYMKTDLINAGIEVFVPDEEDRKLVAMRILTELELGTVRESTLLEFQNIIKKMQQEHGIEAVILGCTELPLLLNPDNCPVLCLDSVEIHLNDLIRRVTLPLL